MASIPLHDITFDGLDNVYTIPQAASELVNDSSNVTGSTVADALDNLNTKIGTDLGALGSDDIANDSNSVSGTSVTNAIDNLQDAIDGIDTAVSGLTASQISNNSTVTGTKVSDALDTLSNTIGGLAGSDIANDATNVSGTSVSDALDTLDAAIDALGSDDIANESNVSGSKVSDALETLDARIDAFDSDDIANASEFVEGTTVTDALEDHDYRLGMFEGTINSASGAIATFESSVADIPLRNVTARIDPVQEGNGDPSPTNVRAISGWTSASIKHTGKNLLDTINKTQTTGNLQYSSNNGVISLSKVTQTSEARGWFDISSSSNSNGLAPTYSTSSDNKITPKGGTYTLTVEASSIDTAFVVMGYTNKRTAFGDSDSLFVRNINMKISQTVTFDNDEWLKQIVVFADRSASSTLNATFSIWLEVGSVSTDYEPYEANTYSITLPSEAGTVYGGTLDVTNGTLTVDTLFREVNGTEAWNKSSLTQNMNDGGSGTRFDCIIVPNMPPARSVFDVVCSHFNTSPELNTSGVWVNSESAGATNLQLRISTTEYSDVNSFESYLAAQYSAGTPVQFAYKIATPITYTLTPTQIRSLLGTNNLLADCGDSTVVYGNYLQAAMEDDKSYTDEAVRYLTKVIYNTTDSIVEIEKPIPIPFTIEGTEGNILYNDGTVGSASSNFSYTDYIDISQYKKLEYTQIGVTSSTVTSGMAFFDVDRTYISGIGSRGSQGIQKYLPNFNIVDVPSNAVYARFTVLTNTNNYGKFKLYGRNKTSNVNYSVISGEYVRWNNGELASDSAWSHTSYIDVSSATKVRYTRTSHTIENPAPGLVFYDADKVYISGVQGRGKALSPDCCDFTEVKVPDGAKYIRVSILNSRASKFKLYLCNAVTDLNDSIALEKGEYVYDPSIAYELTFLSTSGNLTTSTISNLTNPFPVSYGHIYRLKLAVKTKFTFAINALNEYATYPYDTSMFIKRMYQITETLENQTINVDFIVNDKRIKYVSFNIRQNSSIVSFEDIGKFDDDGLGLHHIPVLLNSLYVAKRARHFTDIEWTPLTNLPRFTYVANEDFETIVKLDDQFTAGKTYKGLPYSQGNKAEMAKYGYTYGHIGYDAPLSSFMTSLYNQNSFLYTKTINDNATNQGIAYGVTCDTLVCYALNFNTWYGSNAGFAGLITNGEIEQITTVNNMDWDVLDIGSILFYQGQHVAIITDIVKDADGVVKWIEVSEATISGVPNSNILGGEDGGVCRRFSWNSEDFIKRFTAYTVYRYNSLYRKSSYDQCPYLSVGNEVKPYNLYTNMPIIPFMGENFVYKVGKIQNNTLLVQTNYYEKVAVYKDETLFGTYNYAATLSVPFTAAGTYYAFLYNSIDGTIENMTKKSLACHWRVKS